MKIHQLLIQLLILIIYWLIEKLWSKIRSSNRPGRKRVHYPAAWTILLLLLIWWKVGTYYFAYPAAILSLFGLILACLQRYQTGEFLYSRFWIAYWRLACLMTVVFFVFANLLPPLPTA
ncbi:DUF3397 family protein [Limosilactobacillus secaliphilus]|uniref:Integral membrane protein n=1 Tax=Limosilactobacillus secaliphilus TaxID=396268 RepID=A0A0R2I0Z3_9LACO|nr:DUF3397 family protein [Limosilactobacillus secaliphilus]KRN58680.1 hypothetical protein IV45_GL000304 [Limosilactobacillus secaliphilus]